MIALAALALIAGQAAPAASIEGRWRSPGGNSIIGIAPCGGNLCGTVVWASAKAKQDARKSTDQLIGTQLLTGLQQRGAGWQGRIFIPDKNMRATAKIQIDQRDPAQGFRLRARQVFVQGGVVDPGRRAVAGVGLSGGVHRGAI